MHLNSNILLFSVAWFLFFIHFFANYLLYIWIGSNNSPIYGFLIERGYQWSFGIIVGLIFIVAVFLSFIILNVITNGDIPLTFALALGTLIFYIICICGLNVWGKKFLKKKGMEINHDVGWKAYVKKYKENLAKEKAKSNRDL